MGFSWRDTPPFFCCCCFFLFAFRAVLLCLPRHWLLYTLQPGKTWYKITLLSLTEVCFLSPQYKSRGAKVKVETPAQTDPSAQCQTSDRRQPCTQTLWSEWWMFDPLHDSRGVVTVDATTVFMFAVSALTSISEFTQGSGLPSLLTSSLLSIRITVTYWLLELVGCTVTEECIFVPQRTRWL